MLQGIERDRCRVGRAILPTPKEQTDPCEREGSDSGLRCGALVPLLLIVAPCPAGCRMDAAAHATHVWRRTVGHGQRPWPPVFVPRRAVTGAMPADCGRASAEAERSRCAPTAPRRRGAQTAPAPGRAAHTGQSGWRGARGAKGAGRRPRSGATSAGTQRACGAIPPHPSAVGSRSGWPGGVGR